MAHGIIDSIVPFVPWYIIATWGYLKLTKIDDKFASVNPLEHEQRQYFNPLYAPAAKPLPDQKEDDKERQPKE